MTIALFVTYVAEASTANEIANYFRDEPLTFLSGCAEVDSVDLFVPELGDVPSFEDGVGPPLIVQINVDALAMVECLISATEFSALIMRPMALRATVEQVQLDVFETLHCPVSGLSAPQSRTAPLSFVVRYYRPTEDEAEFASLYVADHPPVMANFPGIQNILCYLPVAGSWSQRFPDSGAFLGNEVVFDDLSALNTALASPVLQQLKAGLREFKPFGYNTHFAMHREQVFSLR